MPLYSYKCSVCGRIDEKFLPVDRRNEEFKCDPRSLMTNVKPHKIWLGTNVEFSKLTSEQKEEYNPVVDYCKGKMKLRISKTSFKFHDPTELEAQYGRGGINDYE